MTSPQAIIIAALVIAVSIVSINAIRPASAQYVPTGAYQLMHHSNPTAAAGVFKLDTVTGEVSYCYINTDQSLTCTRSTK